MLVLPLVICLAFGGLYPLVGIFVYKVLLKDKRSIKKILENM